MSLKENIVYQLRFSRGLLNGVLDSLASPEDWLAQPVPKANHALWIAGHIGLADNRFAANLEGKEPVSPEGWDELFWFGSEISSDASRYPSVDEVKSYYTERRENLLKIIEATDESVLASPSPESGRFSDAPNLAAIFLFAAFHEGMHAGQATVVHRSLGHAQLFQPQPTN